MGPAQGFSGEAARTLRLDGWRVATIAERFGVHRMTVYRACRGVRPDPTRPTYVRDECRRGTPGLLPAQIRAVNERLSKGWYIARICRDLRVRRSSLEKVHARGLIDMSRAGTPPRGASSADHRGAVSPVPRWVEAAGLGQDYRDFAREFGEHRAASECRRLKAEAAACR